MAITRAARPATASSLTSASSSATAPSMKTMLRTVERVLLRDGGHRTALHNARAAVLEGEARSAARAEAHASLQRLASVGAGDRPLGE
jgi:hypothetical protein